MSKKDKRICKCECGGTVRGVEEFGRLWTWCEKCTPVVHIDLNHPGSGPPVYGKQCPDKVGRP